MPIIYQTTQKWGYIIKKLTSILIIALFITGALFAEIAAAGAESQVTFHGFEWGTSMQDFIKKAGNPVHTDSINGMQSLVYDNLIIHGYHAFMVVFFSNNKLEGGTYYFNTASNEEREKCYNDMKNELSSQFGEARLFDPIFNEKVPCESTWRFDSGFIKLTIDTRRNDPVTIWYSSPSLTKQLES